MDWNLKIPCWDFTEFEQGTVPNIDSVSGSSSYEGQGIKGNFSVDLKLGQVIESRNELGECLKGTPNVSKMALSPSGSSKRARPISQVIQAATCLVDGCNADLSSCKEYHRRHKVCEVHSKTPQVSINGQKQRFCQQCSRFHSLEEFDEGKRSCRKRLDGHNRRRRKPQPDALSRGASFFPGHQGATMLQFSNPHSYATTPLTNSPWTGVVKAEEDVKYYARHSSLQNPFPESSSGANKAAGKQQFSFFHDSGTHLELNHHVSPSKALSFASSELFCDGYTPPPPARVVHSDCALSLLSSSPSQTPSATLVQPPGSFSTTANLGLSYGGLESIMVPNTNDHDVGCNGMIHMEPRDHGAPDQTLPFYWE